MLRDIKIAIRQLLNSPGFAATAVLMLALGVGATTAIFSIVEGVLLRPLPFPNSDRVVVLSDLLQGVEAGGDNGVGVTVPDIRNYTRDNHSFTSLGGYRGSGYELSGVGTPAMVNAARLTAGVFPALDTQPMLGRYFTQDEDEHHQQVVVLSYSTWKTRFQGDRKVLGQKILLDRKPFEVIGVMPREFEFPLYGGHLNRVELWVPMSFDQSETAPSAASNWSYSMVGRLKPGVSIEQALSDVSQIAKETVRNYPPELAGFQMHPLLKPLHEVTVSEARPLLRTLFLAVAVVLLIACANLAGLLLVRAIRNRREVAVRLALGASAATLLRQSLIESLVLSVTGGVLGLILAAVGLRLGISFLPETLPLINDIGLDWPVVGFALLLALVTGGLCGIAPAFAAIRTSVNETLKEGGRTGTSGGGHARLRSALVIAEIAIALVLLTASGLLLRSFEKMREVNLGYQADHTLVASYSLPQKQYSTQASVDAFNDELLRRLQSMPGARSVGITTFLPAAGNNNNGAFVARDRPVKPGEIDLATRIETKGDYFQSLGIPLLRGRFFTAADQASSPLVAIVNKKLADQIWPGQNPIGKQVRIGTQAMRTPWMTVVGEVADVKEGSPDAATKQQLYQVIDQEIAATGALADPSDLAGNGGYIALRTAMPPEQMQNALLATVRNIDPLLPLTQVQTMEHAISDTEAPRRFNTVLISSFAAAAVLLAILGIYSVMAFSVAMRVQEIAIRMALGSQRLGILGLIMTSGMKLAAIGCGLGIVGALAASRLLKSLLFGVSAYDPLALTMATVLVLLLALAASLIPARRASSIDPMRALRAE